MGLMLGSKVQLHDVLDAEAFVRANIRRSRVRVGPDEMEELVAEGLVILCDLAGRFKPRMEGYDQDGKFSGYAARFLPVKMREAWHRLHPEHVLRTLPDGTKRYEYGETPWSFNEWDGDDDDEPKLRHVGEFVPAKPAQGRSSSA